MEAYLVNRLRDRKANYLSYHDPTSYEQLRILELPDFPGDNPKTYLRNYGRVRECGELLCFDRESDIYVCNPTNGQTRVLPRSQLQKIRSISFFGLATGFGYDSNSKDFKVVRMMSREDEDPEDNYMYIDKGITCEIYGVKANSWKEISFPGDDLDDCFFTKVSGAGAHVKGTLYWILSFIAAGHVLVSLDLATEEITLLDAPYKHPPNYGVHQAPCEVDGKLGCFVYKGLHDYTVLKPALEISQFEILQQEEMASPWPRGTIEIWLQQEKNAPLEKIRSIEDLHDVVQPLRLELERGLLFSEVKAGTHNVEGKEAKISRLQVYDLNTKEKKLLDIFDYQDKLQIFPYIMSDYELLLPTAGSCADDVDPSHSRPG